MAQRGDMMAIMESALDWHWTRAALEWQLDMGVDETIGEMPVDRFAHEAELRAAQAAPMPMPVPGAVAPGMRVRQPAAPDPVDEARAAADAAQSLDDLRSAMDAFEHCSLRKGARNLVFGDGCETARVMIVGEAPGRDEDLQGKPFVGRAGQLLDRMFGAIGLSREDSVYITNVLPWRPPQNRDPKPEEIAMMQPFLARHVALVDPEVLVIMGNISCEALLGRRGITRLRGTWTKASGRAAMPMFHPAYLLRQPHLKRETWADLLALRARLSGRKG